MSVVATTKTKTVSICKLRKTEIEKRNFFGAYPPPSSSKKIRFFCFEFARKCNNSRTAKNVAMCIVTTIARVKGFVMYHRVVQHALVAKGEQTSLAKEKLFKRSHIFCNRVSPLSAYDITLPHTHSTMISPRQDAAEPPSPTSVEYREDPAVPGLRAEALGNPQHRLVLPNAYVELFFDYGDSQFTSEQWVQVMGAPLAAGMSRRDLVEAAARYITTGELFVATPGADEEHVISSPGPYAATENSSRPDTWRAAVETMTDNPDWHTPVPSYNVAAAYTREEAAVMPRIASYVFKYEPTQSDLDITTIYGLLWRQFLRVVTLGLPAFDHLWRVWYLDFILEYYGLRTPLVWQLSASDMWYQFDAETQRDAAEHQNEPLVITFQLKRLAYFYNNMHYRWLVGVNLQWALVHAAAPKPGVELDLRFATRHRRIVQQALARNHPDAQVLAQSGVAAVLEHRGGRDINLALTRMLAGDHYTREVYGTLRGVPTESHSERPAIMQRAVNWPERPVSRNQHDAKVAEEVRRQIVDFTLNQQTDMEAYERSLLTQRRKFESKQAEELARFKLHAIEAAAVSFYTTNPDAAAAARPKTLVRALDDIGNADMGGYKLRRVAPRGWEAAAAALRERTAAAAAAMPDA